MHIEAPKLGALLIACYLFLLAGSMVAEPTSSLSRNTHYAVACSGGAIGSAQSICSGGDPAAFTEITASTGVGTLSYQ